MKRMTVLFAVCSMFFAKSIQAQEPQGPPKPGPEVKKLDYNIGTSDLPTIHSGSSRDTSKMGRLSN